jgi:UDP-GlcNAc:undecaprenyl-phosphate GlcNAc-1-phosphate transferase
VTLLTRRVRVDHRNFNWRSCVRVLCRQVDRLGDAVFKTTSAIQFGFMVGAVFLSWLILAYARPIGEKLKLIDHPDGLRKVHERATPLVAGLGILLPLFLWCAASLASRSILNADALVVVLLCGCGATLIGYTDDQSVTSPSSRLLSILVFSVIALVLDPHLLPSSIGWLGFGAVPLPPIIAFPLVVIALTGFVNAVNMADGQNGVVIGMAVIWAACIALTTQGATASIAQTLLVTALTAFVFNLAGIAFLGDSGTYGIGFVVGLLAIFAHNSAAVPAQTVCVWFFFPVLDCLRLMVKRLRRTRYPFAADRDHFHHHLQARLGQTLSLVVYLAVVAATSLSASVDPNMAPFCLISLAAFYFTVLLLGEFSNVAAIGSAASAPGGEILHLVDDHVTAISEHRRKLTDQR